MAGLSEYEQRRLENIRHNQQVLRSLHIAKLPTEGAVHKGGTAKRSMGGERERSAVQSRRRSSRLIERETGVSLADKDNGETDEGRVVVERRPRPPRATSRVPFAPQLGATPDYLECFGDIPHSRPVASGDHHSTIDSLVHFELKTEHCVAKVARDRIYSMAVHPSSGCVIAAAGTKEGELALWDATKVVEEGFAAGDGWSPRCFLFAPHSGSISNLRYSPTDPSKLLTTSYDGTCMAMDVAHGAFHPWFSMPTKDDVVTGLDLAQDGRLALHTDTGGVFRATDLRTLQTVQALQLHDAKIGGVSLSRDQHTVATCSNDRSIAIWDLRKMSCRLHNFVYRNAVTSVAFHPEVADRFASTCYDDHLRLHTFTSCIDIAHNNQTGRWITLFKAVWDPKSDASRSLVYIANMERRGLDVYDAGGRHVQCAHSPWLTAQPAVNAVHPALRVVVSGNASGKLAVWTSE